MITSEWPIPDGPQGGLYVKQQADFLRLAGIDVSVFHFQGRKNPVIYWRARAAVRRKLRQQQFDLVHAHFGQSGLLALPKRIPLVVTLHGSDVLGIVNNTNGKYTHHGRLLSRISRWVASRSDAVIVVSQRLQRCLPHGTPIQVIPCGIDFDLFRCISKTEARQHLGLPQEERLVLFAGNPALAVKRHALASQAVDLLSCRLPTRLVVAWGIPYREMPWYMNASDALVLTSMHEGSPGVVKEALACNLPVVSVDVGDVAERLSGVEGCQLCSDDLPETIASALERVLLRSERIKGREAVSRLDERVVTEDIIQVYHDVVGSAQA